MTFPHPQGDCSLESLATRVLTHFGNYLLTPLQGLLNYCLYRTRAIKMSGVLSRSRTVLMSCLSKSGLSSSFPSHKL